MEFKQEQAMEVLAVTPAVVGALLRGKSEAWLNCRKASDTFSPVDVLGHLIYGEMADWIPRARIILECGESRPFDPFDRFGGAPLTAGRPIGELLDRFSALRSENLRNLAALKLDQAALRLTGVHPALGRVTMENLLATWVVHDLGHIAQIVRVMSGEYADAVGPWRAFLSIL